jgi:hypothetical protein
MLQVVYPGSELSGSAQVTELQQKLQAFAQVANNPLYNPGAPTGVIDDKTIRALGNVVGLLKKHVPDEVPSQTWTVLANLPLILNVLQYGGAAVGLSAEDVAEIKQGIVDGISWAAPYLAKGVAVLTVAWPKIHGGVTTTTSSQSIKDRLMMSRPTLRPGVQKLAPISPAQSLVGRAKHVIAAYDPKIKKYRVAVAVTKGGEVISGLGDALGQTPVPEGYKWDEKGTVASAPTIAIILPLDKYHELLKGPWYARPFTWAIVGVVTASVAFGAWAWSRKRAEAE